MATQIVSNVQIDIIVCAPNVADCDAVMNTMLDLAFPPEAWAQVASRSADRIDARTYGGIAPDTLIGETKTTYAVYCDSFPTPFRTGPRVRQL